jgi:hypothetical protein
MSTTTEQNTDTAVIVTPLQQSAAEIPEVCQPGDTACINRWISAFSDCE